MGCTAEPSGVRRPPWEVLPSRRPIVQRPSADCEDDPEPGTRTSTSRKKGLAQGAAIRRPSGPDLLPKGDARDVIIEVRNEHRQRVLTVTITMQVDRVHPPPLAPFSN